VSALKIVIIGAGEVGFHIARRLSSENKDVVVIDNDVNALRRVAEHLDVQSIEGSGSSPAILEEAGIKAADILVAVTDSDETNLVACLFCNILSPATMKLARIRSEEYLSHEKALSEPPYAIDVIINPEAEAVKKIERLLKLPGAVDVGEFAEGRVRVIGVRLDAASPVSGTRLIDLRQETGSRNILVAAINRNEQLIIPSGKDKLLGGDLIYVVAEEKDAEHALEIFGKREASFKKVLIVGGGNLGFKLAKALERYPIHTKLIEKDAARCNMLAKTLNKAVVLLGDGSDQEVLREENVQNMDLVATFTEDEETNILISLLTRQMGARKALTRINKFSYLPLVSAIGLEHIVSSRLAAVNTILQYIRRGRVLAAMALKDEAAEVLEAVALETSDIVGKPISEISFPKGALIVAIIREDEVIVPTGDSGILPQDRIIIFTARTAIPQVEKALMVKLEYF
jgi:trk system potassium uptake protein TrkA